MSEVDGQIKQEKYINDEDITRRYQGLLRKCGLPHEQNNDTNTKHISYKIFGRLLLESR